MKAKTVKRVKVGKKTLYYTSALEYEDKNDPLSKSFSASVDLIERIENMQRLTVSLLATPLMKEVSKTPMIKPPITRTNVLRMNNNFKNALEMYCKLAEYNKDGYTIEKIKNTMRPFADALMSEQTQLILLQQFLYYKYGNKLSEKLWNEYLAEEERQKIKEKETLKLQIEKIKKKIEETGKGYEEYFLLMEKQMVEFDSALKELGLTKAKIDNLNAVVSDMQKQIDVQTANNVSLRCKLQEKETELVQTISRHQEELVKLNNEHEKAIVQLNEEHAKNVSEIEEKHSKEITEEKNKHQEDCATLNKQIEEEKNLKTIFKGQLHGLRNQYGLMTDEEDFTSKEKFNELEEEFLALEKLLKSQWKETKKKIRIEIWKKK